MNNRVKRLNDHIDVDIKTAQRLFCAYDKNIKVDSMNLITEGLSTSNYIIHTENSQTKYLLKIYPGNGGNSAIEVSSYKYAKGFLNVPIVHFFDDSKKHFERTYIILDYIDGISLKSHVINSKKFSKKMAYNVASSLALLHNREYESRALLDKNLNIHKKLPSIKSLYESNLNSFAGSHIKTELRERLLKFIKENENLIEELDSQFVFSHGDFNPSNILVDQSDTLWFIDFEYSLSSPKYWDIGKFFRKRVEMDGYMTQDVFDSFFCGYNSSAKIPLTNDWIKLSRLIDIVGMLGLLNKKSVPDEWVKEIEESIDNTLRNLRNSRKKSF